MTQYTGTQGIQNRRPAFDERFRIHWSVLAFLILIAAALRLAYIGFDSLHLDEAWHMEISTGRGSLQMYLPTNVVIRDVPHCVWLQNAPPWTAIWTHMDWVIHPPLFHTLLRFWRMCFGESGIRAREFSVFWSLVTILLFYGCLRQVYRPITALLGCAIMAVAGSQIAIAQEVRQYAFLVAIGVAAMWAMLRIRHDGITWGRGLVLATLALAMLLTHYFSAGAVVGLAAFASLRLRGASRMFCLLALGTAVVIFAIFWGPTMIYQMSYVHDSADIFLSEPADGHVVRTFIRLATLPVRLTFDPDDDLNLVEMLGVVVLFAAAWSAWRGAETVEEIKASGDPHDAVWLWLLWILGIVGSLAALDLVRSTHHLAFTRYSMLASPALYALLVGAVERGKAWWSKYAVPVGTLLITIAMIRTGYGRRNADVRATAAYLSSIATKDEPILIVSPNPQGRDGQMLYVGLDLYDKDLFPRPFIILTRAPSRELLEALGSASSAILITWELDPVGLAIPGATEIDHAAPGLGVCYRVQLPK
jgi:uncharacterized membrane protein